MTNDKTVTMSRGLLERWAKMAEVFDDGGDGADPETARTLAQEIRALLAAPVVERQPVAWIKHLNGAECKSDGRTYDIMFCVMPGYTPLFDSPPAPVSVVLPRYTCIGKGGEYELLGSAIGAGTLKEMSAIPVYRDTTTGQIFVRTPLDFSTRMESIDKLKELNQ